MLPAWVADILAWPLAIWALLAPQPYDVCVAALGIAPLVALSTARLFEGGTGLTGRAEGDPHGVASLLIGPSLVLAARAVLDVQLLDVLPAVLAGGVIGAIFALAARWVAGADISWWGLACLPVLGFGYGYGLVVEANALLAPARPEFARTLVAERTVAGGSDPTYHLTLTRPLYPGVPGRIEVSEAFYRANPKGAELCVQVYRGAFGWRFWDLDFCPV